MNRFAHDLQHTWPHDRARDIISENVSLKYWTDEFCHYRENNEGIDIFFAGRPVWFGVAFLLRLYLLELRFRVYYRTISDL